MNGSITNAVKRKAAGTKGKLSFSVDFVKAVDGQSIPVNLKYDYVGKSKTAVAVGAAVVVAAIAGVLLVLRIKVVSATETNLY